MIKNQALFLLLFALFGADSAVLCQKKPVDHRQFGGYVKDADGNPVAGANVCIWDRSNRPINGRIPCTDSQKDGKFSLQIPKWEGDTYYIFVEDIEKGYPYTNSALYEDFFRDKQIVNVQGADEAKPVEIRLGEKAGKLIVNLVYDESGKPVESGVVTVCRIDDPKICQSRSGVFPKGSTEILMPEAAVTLLIELWNGEHLEKWTAYAENNVIIQPIRVGLGQKKELKIRLRQ